MRSRRTALACHRGITATGLYAHARVRLPAPGTRVPGTDTLGVALQGFFRHQHGRCFSVSFYPRGRYGSIVRHKLTSDDYVESRRSRKREKLDLLIYRWARGPKQLPKQTFIILIAKMLKGRLSVDNNFYFRYHWDFRFHHNTSNISIGIYLGMCTNIHIL